MRSKIGVYYSRSGRRQYVIEEKHPIMYPFRQMQIGDWFEVWDDEVIGGNFTSLASAWGKQLKRKFQTRTMGSGKNKKIRLTRIS